MYIGCREAELLTASCTALHDALCVIGVPQAMIGLFYISVQEELANTAGRGYPAVFLLELGDTNGTIVLFAQLL